MPNSVLDLASWRSNAADGKPNYAPSGIQTALDYGRTTATQLDEGSSLLSEAAGIKVTQVNTGETRQYNHLYKKGGLVDKKLSGTSNWDFDGDGKFNEVGGQLGGLIQFNNAPVDINNVAPTVKTGCGITPNQSLKSFAEWKDLNLVFLADTENGGDSVDGLTASDSIPYNNPLTNEFTNQVLEDIADLDDDSRYQFIPPPNTDGSSVFNQGSNVPLKFRIFDKDGNQVTNAVVTMKATHVGLPDVTQPFVYDPVGRLYSTSLKLPKGAGAVGEWQVFYFINYQSPNQILVQTPEAKQISAAYTNKFRVSNLTALLRQTNIVHLRHTILNDLFRCVKTVTSLPISSSRHLGKWNYTSRINQ
jgi:hypothetical protein